MRTLVFAALLFVLAPAAAYAGGCYVCASGSAASCRDYCQYDGPDTFDARHRCEAKGCKIAGTSTCPAGPPAATKVCQSQPASSQVIAATNACTPPPRPTSTGPAASAPPVASAATAG